MKNSFCLLFAVLLLLGIPAISNANSYTLDSNSNLNEDAYYGGANFWVGTGYGGSSGTLATVPPDTFVSASLTITEQYGDDATWHAWIVGGNGNEETGTYIGNHQFKFSFSQSDFGSLNWYSNPLKIEVQADCYLESGNLQVTYNCPSVPEPSSILLISSGLIGLAFWKFRAA